MADDEGDTPVVLEVEAPVRDDHDTAYECRARITMPGRVFTVVVPGEDSLQAFKLALSSADRKLRSLAAEFETELFWLDAAIPPVFAELEGLERLEGSVSNVLDALAVAHRTLRDPAATLDDRQQLAERLTPVLDSAGIVDLDGVHLRSKTPAHWGSGWDESER